MLFTSILFASSTFSFPIKATQSLHVLSNPISLQNVTISHNLSHHHNLMAHPWVQELHINPLSIPVTIVKTFPVTPSKPIPVKHGDTLYLSNLDDMIGARVFTPTVYFYQCCSSPKHVTKTLTNALADVLVPYYPLSGRLRETHKGKLEVFFGPQQGALMVEARTNIALYELGELAAPNPTWEPLIFKFPNEEQYKVLEMPLVIAQVILSF